MKSILGRLETPWAGFSRAGSVVTPHYSMEPSQMASEEIFIYSTEWAARGVLVLLSSAVRLWCWHALIVWRGSCPLLCLVFTRAAGLIYLRFINLLLTWL